jgi:hypothetical protein
MSKEQTLTKEQRDWAIAQYDVLLKHIEDGKWDYAKSKLKQELECYKQFTWMQTHPVQATLMALLFLPLAFIPFILIVLVLQMSKKHSDQYETHLVKLKNGNIGGNI